MQKLRRKGGLERTEELMDENADVRWEKEVVDFRPITKSQRLRRRKKVDYLDVRRVEEEEEGYGGLGCWL